MENSGDTETGKCWIEAQAEGAFSINLNRAVWARLNQADGKLIETVLVSSSSGLVKLLCHQKGDHGVKEGAQSPWFEPSSKQ